MKKLEMNQMSDLQGGYKLTCGDVLAGMKGLAGAAAASLTPIGIGFGIAVGLLAYGASCP